MEPSFYPQEKFRVLPLGALALLFVFAAPVFWREVELRPAAVAFAPENQDLRQYYAPVYRNTYEAMRGGHLPLWDATRLCGASLVDDPRVGLFQPLNLVFLLAPFPEAFAVHAFTCLAAAGIAFVLFARSMGMGVTAALFGAIAFAFSGAAAGAMSRPPLAAAMPWIPIVFWAAGAMARRPRPETVVFLGLALSGLLLSGALAILAGTAAIVSGYVVLRALFPNAKRPHLFTRALGGLCIALLLCAGVSAVQLLPVVRLALQLDDPTALVRTVNPAGTVPGSFREAAAQLIAPHRASLPYLMHAGIVVVFLLPAALLQGRRFVDASYFLVAGLGLLAVAIVYGLQLPPGVPVHAIVIPAMTCVAAAAAFGMDRLMRRRAGPGRGAYWLAAGLVACASVLAFVFGTSLTRGYATIAIAIVVALLFARRRWARVALGLVLCGLTWTDLLTSSRNVFGHPYEAAPADSKALTGDAIRRFERGRLAVVGDVRHPVPGPSARVPRIDGFNALFTEREAAWWRALAKTDAPDGTLQETPDLHLLGAMAGTAIVSSDEPGSQNDGLRWTASADGSRYALNDWAVPRAHWVGRVVWVDDTQSAVSSIQGAKMNGDSVYIESEYQHITGFAGLDDSGREGAGATASIQDVSPERVVATLQTPARGVLVLADSFSPDWTVEIDGRPADLVPVNGFMRGVPVPEGDHIVEFQYRPVFLYAGSVLSLGTLALLALWGLWRIVR